MSNNTLSYPQVRKDKQGKYYIDFNLNNNRYRLFGGKIIGSSLMINSYPKHLRRKQASVLSEQVYKHLVANDYSFSKKLNQIETFDLLISNKLKEPLSVPYRKALTHLAFNLREQLLSKGNISKQFLNSFPLRYENNTSYNTIRRHLNVLVNHLHNNGFDIEKSTIKSRKQEEVLHKPIDNIEELLNQVHKFNKNLHLCCAITYCCLLRPHQEIRLLKWKDFSADLKTIHLGGNKVKSKRNRLVPVPSYVRDLLVRSEPDNNIFSDKIKPYNNDYFKTLFRRFKQLNPKIDKGVTLYSFRHSAALNIFKRTGSLTKLQKAMGHSSLKVSLTYLRGLEVPELTEEDMPQV